MPETQTLPIDNKIIFVCGSGTFTVRDIIDAALSGVKSSRHGKNLLGCEAAEHKADEENLEFSDDAIDAAAEQFRYEHDLITAEETEQWLAQRGLNLAILAPISSGIIGASSSTKRNRCRWISFPRLTRCVSC